MKTFRFDTQSLWICGLVLMVTVLGCAEAEYVEGVQKQTAVDRSWSPIEMTKADMHGTSATLGVKSIELQAGETPEQAVYRVFGVTPTYDVRKLLDVPEGIDTNLFQAASANASVCNDSCGFANDGICDEPGYCAGGTDCSDCAGGSMAEVAADEAPAATCPYTNDGFCDEPTYCPVGTDVDDCAQAAAEPEAAAATPMPNSCVFANDGYCDEPAYCDVGTDTNDCQTAVNDASDESAADVAAGCPYTNDGFCDEPTYCAPGTDVADCANAPTMDVPPAPEASDAGDGPDSCLYAFDGMCDEPTYCATGTDTTDCAAETSDTAAPSSSNAPGDAYDADSCEYAQDGVCDEPTYCPYGTDTTDCQDPNYDAQYSALTNADSTANRCAYARDGVCDEPTVCESGTDTDDCTGFGLKYAAALQGESLEMVIIGYTITGVILAWRVGSDLINNAGQVIGTFVAGLRATDSYGQDMNVQIRTDGATLQAARDGVLTGAEPSAASGNVGVATVNYFNAREAESARADGLTCSSATHQAMNSIKNQICKFSGPRSCQPKTPQADPVTYCAMIQARISRGSRCVDSRKNLNQTCYGGLGHADANGNRTSRDEPLENDKRALVNCQNYFIQFCTF